MPETCFAIAAPGLESLVEAELTGLGIRAKAEAGGATWSGSESSIALANLWLRTASRVVMRVTEFRARTFFELERYARRIPFDRFVTPGGSVSFRVTCRKSKLYHSDAVAQRFAEAASHVLGSVNVAAADSDEAEPADDRERQGAQMFIVRLLRDVCTVSVDTSGALLHRRGYRQAVAKAPLRETLAAAMVQGAGWDATRALLDPFCGSGTIPIEAAMLARRIPPGLHRAFAFMRWPEHDAERWAVLREHAEAGIKARVDVPIVGADRDAGAIEAARGNAARAGVADDVELHVRAVSATESPAPDGMLITNPPYGVRVASSGDVRDLYARLGEVASRTLPGWRIAMLSADRRLEAQMSLGWHTALTTTNGGIPVRLVTATVAP